MTVFDAVLLGLLQALGEFLPISSSAHLALLPYLRGMEYQGIAFDIMLHAATLLAVLLYFAKDWFVLIKNGLTKPFAPQGRMLWYLAAATAPAGIAGLFLKDTAEQAFRNPLMMAGCLMAFACLLWWADRRAGDRTESTDIFSVPFKTVFLIGCAQALAIMPGVSRSGITITAALLLGLTRGAGARISFLLSAPIIAGAAAVEVTHLSANDFNATLVWGFISAFLGALVVIGGLMKYIKTHSFDVFVYYRILLGLFIIGFYFWK